MVIKSLGGSSIKLDEVSDELELHLRSLEVLGDTQDQSAAVLYPLVESSLPNDILKTQQRSAMSGYEDEDSDKSSDKCLKSLMKFLRLEVKGAERLSYVREEVGTFFNEKKPSRDKRQFISHGHPTADGLFAAQSVTCIFCDKPHDSKDCFNAQTIPYEVKMRKIMFRKVCKACLKPYNKVHTCKSLVKCLICKGKHVSLYVPRTSQIQKKSSSTDLAGWQHTVGWRPPSLGIGDKWHPSINWPLSTQNLTSPSLKEPKQRLGDLK